MLQIYKDLDLAIPENVEVKIDSRVVTVKGPRGELTKVGIVIMKKMKETRLTLAAELEDEEREMLGC